MFKMQMGSVNVAAPVCPCCSHPGTHDSAAGHDVARLEVADGVHVVQGEAAPRLHVLELDEQAVAASPGKLLLHVQDLAVRRRVEGEPFACPHSRNVTFIPGTTTWSTLPQLSAAVQTCTIPVATVA